MPLKAGTFIPYKELPLSHDFMFAEIMRQPEICRLFLEALLGRPIEKIVYITKQQEVSDSFTSHGIRIDVYLRDEANTVYCVEMQTTTGKILFKRIRYYQSAIDRHNLSKGEHYSLLPESFIIMICTKDLFGYGLALYERKITMAGCEEIDYSDGSHVYLLNSAYTTPNADPAILEFLNCIRTNNTDAAAYKTKLMREVVPAIVKLRDDPKKEAEYMTTEAKLMDIEFFAKQAGLKEGREEGREEGFEEGREIGLRALIETLQALDRSKEEATRIVEQRYGLSEDEAEEKVARYWC